MVDSPNGGLRFEKFAAEDFVLSGDGRTITAKTGMLAEDRSVLGTLLSSGRHEWDMIVNSTRYPDAHIFFGVCDATGKEAGATFGYNPPTGSLYLGGIPNEQMTLP